MRAEAGRRSGKRWLYALLAAVIVVGCAFVAGWWFAGRNARSVGGVVDAYTTVHAGSDSTKDVVDLLPLYSDDAVMRDGAQDRTYEGIAEIKSALNTLLAVAIWTDLASSSRKPALPDRRSALPRTARWS